MREVAYSIPGIVDEAGNPIVFVGFSSHDGEPPVYLYDGVVSVASSDAKVVSERVISTSPRDISLKRSSDLHD